MSARDHPERSAGTIYALLSYLSWGTLPLYWRLLQAVPPFELTVHRIFWCTLTVAAVTAVRGRFAQIAAIFRTPRLLATLAASSLLIGSNWTLYIYCIATDQLVESSLGYFITPLISIVLGCVLLGERLTPARWLAVALVAAAMIAQTIAIGRLPWIAPSLAVTFAFYGYLRKRTPVEALDGLVVECWLLFPFTAGLILWWMPRGGVFPSRDLLQDALLIGGGPLTAVPLVLFAAGARRIRLSTLGFLQYFSPSLSLLIAVFVFREAFTPVDAVSFGFAWVAVVIVALEAQGQRFFARPAI